MILRVQQRPCLEAPACRENTTEPGHTTFNICPRRPSCITRVHHSTCAPQTPLAPTPAPAYLLLLGSQLLLELVRLRLGPGQVLLQRLHAPLQRLHCLSLPATAGQLLLQDLVGSTRRQQQLCMGRGGARRMVSSDVRTRSYQRHPRALLHGWLWVGNQQHAFVWVYVRHELIHDRPCISGECSGMLQPQCPTHQPASCSST
jgi:hypothetical protein